MLKSQFSKINSFNCKASNKVQYICKKPVTFASLGCSFIMLEIYNKKNKKKYEINDYLSFKFFTNLEQYSILKEELDNFVKITNTQLLAMPIISLGSYVSSNCVEGLFPIKFKLDVTLLNQKQMYNVLKVFQSKIVELSNENITEIIELECFKNKLTINDVFFAAIKNNVMENFEPNKIVEYSNEGDIKNFQIKMGIAENAYKKTVKLNSNSKSADFITNNSANDNKKKYKINIDKCKANMKALKNNLYNKIAMIEETEKAYGFISLRFALYLIEKKYFTFAVELLNCIADKTYRQKNDLEYVNICDRVKELSRYHLGNLYLYMASNCCENKNDKITFLISVVKNLIKNYFLFGKKRDGLLSEIFSQLINLKRDRINIENNSSNLTNNFLIRYNGKKLEDYIFDVVNVAREYYQKIQNLKQKNSLLKKQILDFK